MSPEGKIRVISMNSHSPEDTDSYVKGRGCGNLGTGLRFIRTPYLEHGDLKFYACSAKSERRPKYCQLQNSTIKGSQSLSAALNKRVILSSRFQRKCRKPGLVYRRNHRIVSFYFLNTSTCRCRIQENKPFHSTPSLERNAAQHMCSAWQVEKD